MSSLWNKYKEKPYRILIPISALLAAVFIIAGLLINWKGFTENLLAEGTGLAVGIIVALLVVEWYSEQLEKQRWKEIQDITYKALAINLGKIFASAIFSFETEYGDDEIRMIDQILYPQPNTLNAMEETLSKIDEKEKEILSAIGDSNENLINRFYERLGEFDKLIQQEVVQVRGVLIPRLLVYSKDYQLIEKLITLDQVSYLGHSTVEELFIMMSRGVSPEIIHRQFGNWSSKLLGVTRDVFVELCKVWELE